MKVFKTGFEFLWKGLSIGFLNLIATMIVGGVITNIGLKFPEEKGDFKFILFIMFISGFIISIIGGIIVKNLRLPKIGVFTTLYLWLFLNAFTQILEALFFDPGLVSFEVAPAIFVQQSIMLLITSVGITVLFRYKEKANEVRIKQTRSWSAWLFRIIISSGSYVLFYFIFGSINAMLFTGKYYRAGVSGLHLPSTMEILILESIRAVILVLSVLPLVSHLRVSKRKCMLIVGMALFIIGGLLPMLQQLNNLPTVVTVSSIFEMFFQFFLTGVVTSYVLLYEKSSIKGRPSVAASK